VLARADHVLAEQQLKTSELLARADQILAEQELRHTQRQANDAYCQRCSEAVEPGLKSGSTSGEQNTALEAEDDRAQTRSSYVETNPAVTHRLASSFNNQQAPADILSVGKTVEDDNPQTQHENLGGPSAFAGVDRLEGIMRTMAKSTTTEQEERLRIEQEERLRIEDEERQKAGEEERMKTEQEEREEAEEAERVDSEDATQNQPPAAGRGGSCVFV
jgi:hypothetical protein